MKVLQVNNVYAEKSTGRLTQAIHHGLLADGQEALAVYGRGRGVSEAGVIRLCPDWYGKMNSGLARLTGIPYGGCLLSTLRLEAILCREKPDVVHLQCINGNFVNIYRLIRWLKKHRVKTVVSLHAEFLYTGSCGHAFDCGQWKRGCESCNRWRRAAASWKRMREAFGGFEESCVICPVSPWVEERAKQSDILKNFRFRTVYNGVDTAVFYPRQGQRKNAVLHVTAHFSGEKNHPKGGWYVLELAKRMPQVTFLVAGRAEKLPELPNNVILLGEIREAQALAEYYSGAKVTLLTSRRETFSMPCAESLCCGTPVAGFRAGGPETIGLREYTTFVPFGDLDALEEAVSRWLDSQTDPQKIASEAEACYCARRMLREFEEVYGSLL